MGRVTGDCNSISHRRQQLHRWPRPRIDAAALSSTSWGGSAATPPSHARAPATINGGVAPSATTTAESAIVGLRASKSAVAALGGGWICAAAPPRVVVAVARGTSSWSSSPASVLMVGAWEGTGVVGRGWSSAMPSLVGAGGVLKLLQEKEKVENVVSVVVCGGVDGSVTGD
uniref:Uncharacterized protein n=1 Tax=Leersia perrieri TaxID=77586 RepID=A0A0D9V4C6_9ORYZ